MWQLLKVLLRLTHNLFVLLVQLVPDTVHCAGTSAIADPLVNKKCSGA